MAVSKKTKWPKNLGACVDLLYENRKARLEEARKIDELKATEKDLENHIINSFTKTELQGAKGSVALASIKSSDVPNIEDWDLFLAYVIKNKAYHLLNKGCSTEGVRELWAQKKKVPGIGVFNKVSLSLTKVR